jgi:uncharacterized protein YhaN
MQLKRLDLLAFGPFTDRSLEFGEDSNGLHVVYGPNEAGKSSALRALRQLLYGIDHKSGDGFIHPYERMRVGALLTHSDGRMLECVRRKGRTNTLLDPTEETVLDEGLLHNFLGGVDLDGFRKMFGIDHTDLVRGGREILAGKGDIGRILFSAGAGISNLKSVQETLEKQVDGLFKPSGKKPVINTKLSRLREVQAEMRSLQLSGSRWAGHDRELRLALKRREEVATALEELQRKYSLLDRIHKGLPAASVRREIQARLRELTGIPLLPEDFSARRQQTASDLRVAEHSVEQIGRALEQTRETLAGLDVPESLLAEEGRITALYQAFGGIRKAAEDRRVRIGQLGAARRNATSILRELGRDPEHDDPQSLQVPRTDRVRLKELMDEDGRLVIEARQNGLALSELGEQRRILEMEQARLKPPRKVAGLKQTLERVMKLGDLEDRAGEMRLRITEERQQVEASLLRAGRWEDGLEGLETAAFPSLERIDEFSELFQAGRGELNRVLERKRELQNRLREIADRMQVVDREESVPVESDLHSARQHRDFGWKVIKAAWLGNGHDPGVVLRYTDGQGGAPEAMARAYEEAAGNCDRMADRMRDRAEAVAGKSALLQERARLERDHQESIVAAGEREKDLKRLEKEWTRLWAAHGLVPGSPREMGAWVRKMEQIQAGLAAIREKRGELHLLEDRIRRAGKELEAGLVDLGEAVPPGGLVGMVDHCRGLVAENEERAAAVARVDRDLDRIAGEERELLAKQEELDHRRAAWKASWAPLVTRLGLHDTAGSSQVQSVLELLDELRERVKEQKEFQVRIDGIDRDAEQFERELDQLLARILPGLRKERLESGIDEMHMKVEQLHAELVRARAVRDRAGGLAKELADLEKQQETVRTEVVRLQGAWSELCREAGCGREDDLARVENLSARKRREEELLRNREEQLLALSGGIELEEFVELIFAEDADTLEPRLEALQREIGQLHEEASELDQRIGTERAELARMDGRSRAADLAEESQSLLGSLERDMEEYVRLRFSAIVLKRSIERYRDRNQGPLVRRASELFSRMTLGNFSGLRVQYAEKDPVLVGVRTGSRETIPVEGMSEGTADQLYLAFRLAGLEQYLEHNEPVPFVVDDILITFDDDRSRSTLRALADLAGRTQVIFFTHHAHLVELARESVASDVLSCQEI